MAPEMSTSHAQGIALSVDFFGRFGRAFGALVVIVILGAANADAAPAGAPGREPGTQQLATFSINGATGAHYEIALGPCKSTVSSTYGKGQWRPIFVRFRKAKKIQGAVKLTWADAPCKAKVKHSTKGAVWTAQIPGPGDNELSLKAQLVAFAPKVKGLLLTQVAGFEHLVYSHQIVLFVYNKLATFWKVEGNYAGAPIRDSVTVKRSKRVGQKIIVHTHISRTGSQGSGLDQWKVTPLTWHPRKKAFRALSPTEAGVKGYAAIAGTFVSEARARKFLEKHDCLFGHQLLKSDDFANLKPGLFIVAQCFLGRAAAKTAAKKNKKCRSGVYVKRLF